MGKRYDVESLLAELKAICVDDLNNKLDAIATEKGDSMELPHIDDRAFVFQSFDRSSVPPFPQFIFYGLDLEGQVDGIGPHTAEQVTVLFLIVSKDNAKNDKYLTQQLRYGRALREIFEEGWSKISAEARIFISSLAPIVFEMHGLDGSYRAVGVKIRTTLT